MNKSIDPKLRLIDVTGLCMCVALTAVMYFVAVRPVLDKHKEQREQQAQLETENSKADELGVSLSTVRQSLTEAQEFVADRPLQLKPTNYLNQRLAQVTALAGECDLYLDKIEPGEHVIKSHYVTVPIRITGQGGYASAVKFFDRLHHDWPDLAVASLSLVGNPRTRSQKPTFIFELLWFSAPDL